MQTHTPLSSMDTPIILIVPHGHEGDCPKLVEITEALQKKLNGSLFINKTWKKGNIKPQNKKGVKTQINPAIHRLDLYSIDQALQYNLDSWWLDPITKAATKTIEKHGTCRTIILCELSTKELQKAAPRANILIGAGQSLVSSGKENRQTVTTEFLDSVVAGLNSSEAIKAVHVKAGEGHHQNKYAGWDKPCLNQLYSRFTFADNSKPESLVINIDSTLIEGHRELLLSALCASISSQKQTTPAPQTPELLEPREDKELITTSVNRITDIFTSHVHNALTEVGSYLLETFFDGDIELARQKKPVKDMSFNQVVKELETANSNGPKKSWLFNALNLTVQEHDLVGLTHFDKLSGSQKVLLLTIHDSKLKKELVIETAGKGYSVRDLKERIKAIKTPPNAVAYISQPAKLFTPTTQLGFQASFNKLKESEKEKVRGKLIDEQRKLEEKIRRQSEYLSKYGDLLERLSQ